MATKNSSKPGRYKEQRIVDGILHNVITENGKIVKDNGPFKRYQEQDQTNVTDVPKVTEEKRGSRIPLVAEDGSYLDQAKRTEETTGDNTIKPNDTYQEQKPKNSINLVPISTEELGDILKQDKQKKAEHISKVESVPKPKLGKKPEWEDILSKIPEPDPDRQNPQESKIAEIEPPIIEPPIIEPPKLLQVPIIEPPKIAIPKVQINVPPKNDTIKEPIKLDNISNKLGEILATDTYRKPKGSDVVESDNQKANENNWYQQHLITKEKPTKEKRRFMSEELEAELLDERKFEQWMKKQKFHENLEKAARFAEETKEQFEVKIPELSGKIEDVTGEVKNVENKLGTVDSRLGTVDKSIGTLCTGIDCVKEDVKKYQTSQQALEKLVQDRFSELSEKVQSLDRPTFTCENCGEPVIAPLSSYCPNCGSQIQSWSDEEGEPVRGWSPYWKRSGKIVSQ